MNRITVHNLNTVDYWDRKHDEYQETLELDKFKLFNVANHIQDETSVLDLGCGDGEFCRMLKQIRSGCKVTGVDFSEKAIIKAVQKGGGIYYYTKDVLRTGFNDKEFDCVVCLETLEHMENPDKLAEEIARIGKTAILTTPYLNHIPSPEHIWEFDYKDLENLFKPYYKEVHVFPWAAGWSEVKNSETGEVVYPKGHWCTIMVLAK